jgi:ribosomal protein S18 acetylase RimI-like enzyme
LAGGKITIRSCRRGEEQAILELWALARSDHASTPDRREDVESLIDSGSPAALLVAEMDGRIVGAVVAGWDGWRGNIYRLAVHDDHRRRGIGLLLTRAAEDYFRSRDVRRVTALVAFDDGAAGAFWDAVGYPQDQGIGRRVRNIA